MEEPNRQFWRRVALVAPLVGVCALAAALVTAQGLGQVGTAHASLRLCWCLVAVAAGGSFCLRWRLTGEAPVGLLGAALVVWSLPQLPFALAEVAVDPEATWRRLSPLTRMTVMVPTAWLLLGCIRSPQVDSALRPWRQVLGYSVAAAAAAGALTTGQALGVVAPPTPPARLMTDGGLAALVLFFAWRFARGPHGVDRALADRTAVGFCGLGLATLVHAAARLWSLPLLVFSEFVSIVSMVLLALLATSLLRSAVDFYGLRMLSLRMEADSAEDAVRREHERMHEVRATVAGIRQASGTLSHYAHRLEPGHEHDLQQMMAAELTRLERLLTSDWRVSHAGPVMLDDLIRPVVVCQRERGVSISWRPTGACALADRDGVTEALGILLDNARSHAPGAAVRVVVAETRSDAVRVLVRDDGPGIPTEVRDRVFDRGARRPGSPGQGLGLHIARELAQESGGDLDLLPPVEGEGACFALTLPAVSDPTAAARPAYTIPLEEAG